MSAPAIEIAESGIRQDPLSCWWKIPNKSITVQLDLQVIERINDEMRNAAASGSSDEEIGGLLLGTVTFDPSMHVMATECFPMPCTHELGPSHHLSFADRRLLWKQINTLKKTWGERQYFVSYYRSNLRADFQLTGSDLALARDFAPDLSFFLLIQPISPTNIGGLFFADGESTQPENRILFPFDTGRLLSGDRISKDFPQDSASVSPTMAVGEEDSAESPLKEMPEEDSCSASEFELRSRLRFLSASENTKERFQRLRLWMALGGFLMLSLIGIFYMRMKPGVVVAPQTEMESAADLGLETKVGQNRLYLKWNKMFPGVLSAKKGILSIRNGTSTQTTSLSLQELLQGVAVLPYIGTPVSVQLLLVSEESALIRPVPAEAAVPAISYSEGVPDMAGASSRASALENRPQTRIPVAAPSPKLPSPLLAPPPIGAAQTRVPPKGARTIAVAETDPAPIRAVRAAQSPGSQPLSVVADALPRLTPAVTAESPRQNQPAPPREETPAARPLQSSTFPPAASSEPVSAKADIADPRPAPVAARSTDAVPASVAAAKPKENPEPPNAFIPPRPIEALNPIVLPSSLKSQMPESMQIDIRVYVDVSGAVIGAKSLSENVQISRLAVDAVRRMRFVPAHRGNQNMASDLILKLRLVAEESR